MSAEGPQGPEARNCLTDEGRSLGVGLPEQIPNHLWRLWSKAMVVSAEGKGPATTGSLEPVGQAGFRLIEPSFFTALQEQLGLQLKPTKIEVGARSYRDAVTKLASVNLSEM